MRTTSRPGENSREHLVGHVYQAPKSTNQWSLGKTMRSSFARKTMVAVMGISTLNGCLPEPLSDAEIQAKIKAAHAHDDLGGSLDGYGDSSRGYDAGSVTDDADEQDTKDGSPDESDADADDSNDGDADDASDGTDATIINPFDIKVSDDASDGSTDNDIDANDSGPDGVEDANDGTDGGDAVDGANEASETNGNGPDGVEDANDGTDGGPIIIADADDASDSITDDTADTNDTGPVIVADANDADNSGPDTQDAPDVPADVPPKTCDGKPINSVMNFYSGPKGTQGEGICQAGIKQCKNDGTWEVIDPEVTPQPDDKCDGLDNNCNSKTDEDNNIPYSGLPGTQDVGMCKAAIVSCSGKVIQEEVIPAAEKCDKQDNDCNGKIDDGLFIKSKYGGPDGTEDVGVCVAATQSCIDGATKNTAQVLPSGESCNNKDDNCDGVIDNGLTEKAYSGAAKTQDVGICKSEVKDCVLGAMQLIQLQVLPGSEEICGNGLDDNCNGITDEAPCNCDPDKDGKITDQLKDPLFLAAMRTVVGKGPGEDITLADAQKATTVTVASKGITSIAGIECFPNTTYFNATSNKIKAIPQLQWLFKLKDVYLNKNGLANAQPLIDAPKFGVGCSATIIDGNFISVDQADQLKAKGVSVN